MNRARIAAVATIVSLCLAGMLVASPVSAAPSKKTADPVTLTLLFPTASSNALDLLIANFHRVYPDIRINPTYISNGIYAQTLLTQLQAGNAADLFYAAGGTQTIAGVWPLAASARLVDLSGSPWNKRIWPAIAAGARFQGRTYAWPQIVSVYGVVYNVDLFNQLRLKVPTTFSEVLALCRTISSAGKIPFAQAIAGGGTFAQTFFHLTSINSVYSVKPTWDADRIAKKATFASDPGWTQAMQQVVDMKNNNCFDPGLAGTTTPQQNALFANGQAAMMAVNSATISSFADLNPKLNFGMFAFPASVAKNTRIPIAQSLSIAANKATKNPDAAKTFINFVARVKQNDLYAKVANALPMLDGRGKKPTVAFSFMKPMMPLFDSTKVYPLPNNTWPSARLIAEAFAPGIAGLITGQTTVQGVLSRADEIWNGLDPAKVRLCGFDC
jgi:raffinose/stachyose/melibiose transport system substrate-binding protein